MDIPSTNDEPYLGRCTRKCGTLDCINHGCILENVEKTPQIMATEVEAVTPTVSHEELRRIHNAEIRLSFRA